MQLIAGSGSGTLYPPHSMHPEVFNIDKIKKLCIDVDDIWLKIMQVMSNTPVVLVKQSKLKYVSGTQDNALWNTNEWGNNDICMKKILNEYNLFFGEHDSLLNRMTHVLPSCLKENKEYDIFVSVIIPCYNSERFINECLESILAQTLKNIEIICVDDGSTDNTVKIIKQYADKDARVTVLLQENKYAGVARNYGMSVASGKYLYFMDSDDFCDATILEKMYNRCEEDDADICLCGAGTYDMSTKQTRYLIPPRIRDFRITFTPFSRFDVDKIFSISNASVWTKLFRTNFVRSHKLQFQDLQRANDVYFVRLATVLAERITIVDQWLYTYRRNTSTSLVETLSSDPFCFYKAHKEVKKHLVELGLFHTVKKAFDFVAMSSAIYALELAKTKELWLEMVTFIKEKYIPEFELKKELQSSFPYWCGILRKSKKSLLSYEPKLRKDESSGEHIEPWLKCSIEEGEDAKLSVVLHVSRTDSYFSESLHSVMQQSLSSIDILVCAEHLTETVMSYISFISESDSRIKLISTIEELPSSICGDYTIFVNSDDLLTKYALENLYKKALYFDTDVLCFQGVPFYDNINIHKNIPKNDNKYRFKGSNYATVPSNGKSLIKELIAKDDLALDTTLCIFKTKTLFHVENAMEMIKDNNISLLSIKALLISSKAQVHKVEDLYIKRMHSNDFEIEDQIKWKRIMNYYNALMQTRQLTHFEDTKSFRLVLRKLERGFRQEMLKLYRFSFDTLPKFSSKLPQQTLFLLNAVIYETELSTLHDRIDDVTLRLNDSIKSGVRQKTKNKIKNKLREAVYRYKLFAWLYSLYIYIKPSRTQKPAKYSIFY